MRKWLIILGAVGGLGFSSWLLGWSELFQIREISIEIRSEGEGRNGLEGGERLRLKAEEVRELIGIKLGENIFRADLRGAQEVLLRHPLVREVAIRRALPGRVLVEVEEREPCLLVALGKDYYWADREGYLLGKAAETEIETGSSIPPPFLFGARVVKTERGLRLCERGRLALWALCDPDLDRGVLARFSEIRLRSRSSSPELILQGREGFQVLLDLEDLWERLRLLSRLLTRLKGGHYLYIDLRFGDVVLRPH